MCKPYRHGLGKDAVLCFAPPNGCRDTLHPTSHLENKDKLFSGDQVVGRQKLAHHQEYCSDICGGCVQYLNHMIFVVDLIACRLNCFMSAVAFTPVTPRLWSGFLVWLL